MGDDAIANRQHHQELPLGGGGGEDGSPDLISRLPDEVLGDIISLLSIRDGARTQAISRRWWPLWRAAPLNLKVYGVLSSERKGVVTKILLSEHTGPVRCFHLHDFELNGCYDYAMLDGWLRSRAFTGLREIYFRYWWAQQPKPMPPSALRFAPTLCVAWIPFCEFPSELSLALGFPHLKKLSLRQVTISEDALHSLLSALCHIKFQELVIEDAARLEGLFLLQYAREMIALSLTTLMRTVKILALESLGPNLDSVVDFLKCFPCVDKLYIMAFDREETLKNERAYNPLDPMECLELHLKKVTFNNYDCLMPYVDFAKFFVLNAKVLKKMDLGVLNSCSDKWMASQYRLLQLDNKASPGARFAFARGYAGHLFVIFCHSIWVCMVEWVTAGRPHQVISSLTDHLPHSILLLVPGGTAGDAARTSVLFRRWHHICGGDTATSTPPWLPGMLYTDRLPPGYHHAVQLGPPHRGSSLIVAALRRLWLSVPHRMSDGDTEELLLPL
nr:unnamed protein product [Digitaria exilis]